jgi:hypothetical protein
MADSFYILPKNSITKVREILLWAHKNGLKTEVDQLDCSVSWCRTHSDKAFEEVMKLLDKNAVGFFRVVFRRQWNPWLILTDKSSEPREIVEIFIRNINVGKVEYFFFIYLEPEKLEYLKEKYKLVELG